MSRARPWNPAGVAWWWFCRMMSLALMKLVYRLRCAGGEQVPRSHAAVLASNHQSHLDPVLIGCMTGNRPFVAIARSGLFKFKPFAWLMRSLGGIAIDQNRGDVAAMKAAIEALQRGRCVLIFPEGGRTRDGVLAPMSRGVLVLIKRAQAAVVPIAVDGAYDVWPIHRRFPRLHGRIGVKAGRPISYDELTKDGENAALERLAREIETLRLEIRTELRQASGGRYPARDAGDAPFWAANERMQVASQDGSASPSLTGGEGTPIATHGDWGPG